VGRWLINLVSLIKENMIHEQNNTEHFGGIKMSEISKMDYLTLKTEWIDISHDIENLKTLKKKFPKRKDVKEKLECKESLKEVYESELKKRRPLKW
ncbi:MAG: hypothetical protein K8E24_002915, partial [Methanobacterium paludis]|nr:hypothetical protein [Methanobacterium paludis]